VAFVVAEFPCRLYDDDAASPVPVVFIIVFWAALAVFVPAVAPWNETTIWLRPDPVDHVVAYSPFGLVPMLEEYPESPVRESTWDTVEPVGPDPAFITVSARVPFRAQSTLPALTPVPVAVLLVAYA
jgi:hypothetical protein